VQGGGMKDNFLFSQTFLKILDGLVSQQNDMLAFIIFDGVHSLKRVKNVIGRDTRFLRNF
jgi:hypothetical protein